MTHGMHKSPTYSSWGNMIQRCTNPKSTHYNQYGSRGIKVCQRWLSFENFLADMGKRKVGMTLERIDNNGDYEPGNCKWATRSEQAYNRRTNVRHKIGGITKTTTEWLRYFNIKQSTFDQRVYVYRWPVLKALSTPTRKRG